MIASARLGDSHVCPIPGHGTTSIVSASSNVNINSMGSARVGDTCGCGAVITTGFPSILINGRPMAHLGSPTSHGGSITTGSSDTFGGFTFAPAPGAAIINFATLGAIRADGSVDEQRMAALLADPALVEKAEAANALVNSATQSPMASLQQGIEPGFHIVEQPMSRSALESMLFAQPDSAVLAKFRTLNPQLTDYAKPGQLIVLSDPANLQCSHEEAWLMEAAEKVNAALEPMSDEEAGFLARNRHLLESFVSQGSTALGVGSAIFAKNLEDMKASLRDIESLHKRSFQQYGHLRSADFFVERKRLLAQLDTRLTAFTRAGIGFPEHPKLKTALGISSRSLVHHWTLAGAQGQIPGYATHMQGVAKAAKYVKYAGRLGIGLGGGASYMKVQDVCTAGDREACERVRLTEAGNFMGTVGGGVVAGSIFTGAVTGTICVALGVPTVGTATVICGLVVAGAGSYAGGAAFGALGESIGEVIYERSR
ncbi:PAAR domain-containing protein [Pseudomonas sp. NFIX28]|uniref:PAAR domain-containing protein n=1 Tax=Pseudomonas sp. NFIX28 TaxID=1566235 RepID=UPI00089A427B|nr:PAAR domain-containing protein [Pseudomonas sp. NFIX28]SDZ60668.1 Zn-binding Pro-Ala-Ala-Arg (PAAR) domain-containing protein, incolved in TypeVI secretion [Pseudomonas sp. NFIX28]